MARLLFFGKLRDIAGAARTIQIGADTRTLAALRARLCAEIPQLAPALQDASVRAAIDQVFADDAAAIDDSSEIAFMPPMSGG